MSKAGSTTIVPIYVEIERGANVHDEICRLEEKLHGRDGFVFITGNTMHGRTIDQLEKDLKAEGKI